MMFAKSSRSRGGVTAPTASSFLRKRDKSVKAGRTKRVDASTGKSGVRIVDLTKKKDRGNDMVEIVPPGSVLKSRQINHDPAKTPAVISAAPTAKSKSPLVSTRLTKPETPDTSEKRPTKKAAVKSGAVLKGMGMTLNGPWALHKKQTTMLQNVVAKQTEDLHEVQSYQDMLRKKLEHSNKSYSELKASYRTLQTHSNSVQERLTDVEARLREQSLAYDAKVAALDDKTDMIKFLRGQLDLETEANQTMTRNTHGLKTALQASEREVANMQALYDNVEDERDTLLGRVETLERRVELLKKDRTRYEKHIDILRKEKDRAFDELKEVQRKGLAASGTARKTLQEREASWSVSAAREETKKINIATAIAAGKLKLGRKSGGHNVTADSLKLKSAMQHLEQEQEKSKLLESQLSAERAKSQDLRNRLRNLQRYAPKQQA